jgi:uncharacterized membrane protein YhaH (DUF805 family)
MMNWYLTVLKKYAVFDGRARRKEYWFFQLINTLILIVLVAVGGVAPGMSFSPARLLIVLYLLAVLLPSLGVTVRRLHDTGRSGWWIFISFVPFVGGIILLVFTFMDSQPNANQYGPNPKEAASV